MVRAFFATPGVMQRRFGHRRICRRLLRVPHALVLAVVVIAGCAIVPNSRMDESQKLIQSLRADNARLKDRVLALQGQTRDYAERAVDDGRRLALQDETIERLEHSVQAYQDERTRLEAAYKQLVANLGVVGPDGDTTRGEAPAATSPARVSRGAAGTDDHAPH